MAVTTITSDFLVYNGKKRALQQELLRAQHNAIVDKLPADASCPSEFLCPISLEIMHFPVMVMATGQKYDLSSILTWISSGGTTCPLTGVQLGKSMELRMMKTLHGRITAWLTDQGVDLEQTVKEADETWHANHSTGETKQPRRKLLATISAVFRFLAADSRMYSNIY